MFRGIIVFISFVLMFQPYLMGGEEVIIAVAADGETLEDSVSHVAARCPYFLIVDSKGELLEAVENPYKDTRGGAGVSAANFLAGKNVTVVVAGSIGNKMRNALEEQEITYCEFEGNVEEAIREILEKEDRE
jgi:predicted Fe-Mo cluster-binding NifX family protein